MAMQNTRKIIGTRDVRALLGGISRQTLSRFRTHEGFPAPVPMPGHPRFYEDEILEWRDPGKNQFIYTAAEQALPDLQSLPPAERHKKTVEWFETALQRARERGADAVIRCYEECLTALRTIGPRA